MKKTPTTSALLEQLAQSKTLETKAPQSSPQPDNVTTYQPDRLSGKPKKADSGSYKGIWLRTDEMQLLNDMKRKLYLDGMEVSPNLIIRALIHDLAENPRIVDQIRNLKDY